jgi:hypothetical protein
MADRLVPTHFRSDGQPKRGYEREDVARAEAERLGMSYYRCDFCGKYHLASKGSEGSRPNTQNG